MLLRIARAELCRRGAQQLVTGPELDDPGVAAHLLACGPCAEDYEGLLAAARADRN
jgi:hypothetical protein